MQSNFELLAAKKEPKGTLSRLIWLTPLAILAATVANLGLYLAIGSIIPDVTAWPGAGPGQIAGANVIYLLIGAIILAVIARLSSQPAGHYVIVASIGLLISLALPISAGFGSGLPGTPPASVATVIVLSLMHIIAFAISVPLFIRYALD